MDQQTVTDSEKVEREADPGVPSALSEGPAKIEGVSLDLTHIRWLDGLRACAAVYVFLHHLMRDTIENSPAGGTAFGKVLIALLAYGGQAVVLFIILSGYVLTIPVMKRSGVIAGGTGLFFARRATRILPPYYSALILNVVAILFIIGKTPSIGLYTECANFTKSDLLTHVLLIHQFFKNSEHQICYVFWSIGVEWWIYFLFPMIVSFARKSSFLVSTASFAIAAIVLHLAFQFLVLRSSHGKGYNDLLDFVAYFNLGVFAAYCKFGSGDVALKLKKLLNGYVVWALILFAALSFRFAPLALLKELPIALAMAAAILLIENGGWAALRKVLGSPLFASVGGFSYTIYLLHPLWLQIVSQFVLHPLGLTGLTAFGLSLLIGVPMAILIFLGFYLAIEKPFVILSRNIGRKNPRPGQAAA